MSSQRMHTLAGRKGMQVVHARPNVWSLACGVFGVMWNLGVLSVTGRTALQLTTTCLLHNLVLLQIIMVLFTTGLATRFKIWIIPSLLFGLFGNASASSMQTEFCGLSLGSSQTGLSSNLSSGTGSPMLPLLSHEPPPLVLQSRKTGQQVKCATFNIRRSLEVNLPLILQWAEKEEIDVLFLQETGVTERNGRRLLQHSSYVGFFSFEPSEPVSGCAVLLKNELARHVISTSHLRGRMVSVTLGFRRKEVRLVSVYWPANQKYPNFKQLQTWLNSQLKLDMQQSRESILGGDWNEALHELDRTGDLNPLPKQKSALQTLLEFDLVDAFHSVSPTETGYTFFSSKSESQSASRIDAIWCSSGALANLRSVQVEVAFFDSSISDHKPLVATFYQRNLFEAVSSVKPRTRLALLPDQASQAQKEKFCTTVKSELTTIYKEIEALHSEYHPENQVEVMEAMEVLSTTLHSTLWKVGLVTLPKKKFGGIKPIIPNEHPLKQARWLVYDSLHTLRLGSRDVAEDTINELRTITTTQLEDEAIASYGQNLVADTADKVGTLKQLRNRLNVLYKKHISIAKAQKIATAIESRHEIFTSGKVRSVLNNVLEKAPKSINVDRIKVECGEETLLSFEEDEVQQAVVQQMQHWFRPRKVKDLPSDSLLHQVLQPRDDIDPEWYSEMMKPPDLEEVRTALTAMGRKKTPGPSQITKELFLAAGDFVLTIVTFLLQQSFIYSDIPPSWGLCTIIPIPKKEDWGGILTNTRPISLLEVILKLQQKIYTDRMKAVFLKYNHILTGLNSAILPGYSTSIPIGIIQHCIDLAQEDKQPLYLVLNDIQKAFDSIPAEGLIRAWRVLRLPESFITLKRNSFKHARASVLTAFGLTEVFKLGCIVQQGSVDGQAHCGIFLEPLLRALQLLTKGVTFEVKHQIDTTKRSSPILSAKASVVAHADDTNVLSRSRKDLEKQIRLVVEYQDSCEIFSNVQKVAILGFNLKGPQKPIKWGSHGEIPIQVGAQAERILGIYRSANGDNKPTEKMITQTTNSFINAISTKAISDKVAIYCINRVLFPKLQYLWKFSILSQSFLQTIDRKLRSLARAKLSLAKSTPNPVLYHQHIYNLQSVVQTHQMDHVLDTIMQLNDNTLLGQIARIRLLQLQYQCHTTTLPLTKPSLEPFGKGYFAKVQPCFVRMGLHIESITSPPELTSKWGHIKGGSQGLDTLLNHFEMKDHYKTLRQSDVWFVDQLTSVTNKKYINSADINLASKPKELLDVIHTLQEKFGQRPLKESWELGDNNLHYRNVKLKVASTPWKVKSFGMHLSEEPGSEPTIFKIQKLILDKDSNTFETAKCQHYRKLKRDDVAGMKDWRKAMREFRFYLECEGCHLNSAQSHNTRGTCFTTLELNLLQPATLYEAGSQVMSSLSTIQSHTNKPQKRTIYGLEQNDDDLEHLRAQQYPVSEEEEDLEDPLENQQHPFRRFNSILTIMGNQTQTLSAESALIQVNNKTLELFTDGSLTKGSNMGIGIFSEVPGQEAPLALSFRLKDLPASSYTAELAGLLLGHTFENSTISISLDNQAVVTTYKSLYSKGPEPTPRELLKTPNGYFWSVITKLRQLLPSPKPSVKWIKGHAGNKGNEKADKLAGTLNSPQLVIKLDFQHTLPFILGTQQTHIYGQIRKELKEMCAIRNHQEWIHQHMFSFLRPSQQWNLELTFLVLHGGLKPSHQFSTMRESHKRKFRVQLMHRLLPTQQEMFRRRPDLYSNGLCRVCLEEVEDFNHLFSCQHSIIQSKEILHTLAKSLSSIVSEANVESDLSHPSAWLQHPSLDVNKAESLSTLTGLIPQEWVHALREEGISSETITKELVSTMRHTLKLVHENIWLPRCEKTIAWEKEHKITQKSKVTGKTKQQTARVAKRTQLVKHECHDCRGKHTGASCPDDIQAARTAARVWSEAYLGITKIQAGVVGISKKGLSDVDTVVGEEALRKVGDQVNAEK